jgi:hypothetical protein
MIRPRIGVAFGATVSLLALGWGMGAATELSVAQNKALNRVTADSLRASVRYLASDELKGRGTPSPGLDQAAAYIAGAFKRAGLVAPVDGSYFQATTYKPRNGEAGGVKNVIGLLPGTDPKLKDTYVLVTAHYDHLGQRGTEGDTIFNGANDDASGTAAVMEIANALRDFKPRRSIVFMAFWGEEQGLRGSAYYGANPVFPIDRTVAMVNIEQIGRTDDTEGLRVGAVSITGFDFSSMSNVFNAAGKATGIGVQKHPVNSDRFFVASDNAALALKGIPAHTVCTAFMFPDYHQPGDHWDKLDYGNMAKVSKMIALSTIMLADSDQVPKWDESNPKTQRFRDAQKAMAGGRN